MNERKNRPSVIAPERHKKANPDVAALGKAKMGKTLNYDNSHIDSTIARGVISRLLLRSRENALHLRDLVTITGLSEREVRQQIHIERRRGIPILSDNLSGYYLPQNEAERVRCVRSLRHRAAEILKAAAAIEGENNLEGQLQLGMEDGAYEKTKNAVPEKTV